MFHAMRAESIGTARTTMKDFTRHNDKLGIDWSKIENGPVASYSHQFSESAYGKDDQVSSPPPYNFGAIRHRKPKGPGLPSMLIFQK